MEQSYLIDPVLQTVRPNPSQKRKGSKMFTFDLWMEDIIVEFTIPYKLTSGVVKVHGWTEHETDIDIDATLFEKSPGVWHDIKKYLEHFGGMKEIDKAAREYVLSVVYKKNIYKESLREKVVRFWNNILHHHKGLHAV